MSAKPLVSLLMIVKDERYAIEKTLASTLPYVDRFTILDTGSTDGTQEIIEQLSTQYGVSGRVFEEPFVDFSTSRNRCIELADREATYFLTMDANDELRAGGDLIGWCERYRSKQAAEFHSFLMRVKWNHEIFTMQRLFRGNAGCRYRGVVHEYLETEQAPTLTVENAYIFHERRTDEGKSRERWQRDCLLLEEELRRKPNDLRSLFYLAQSCVSTERYGDGFDYYTRRAELGGEDEETYIALFRRAELGEHFLGYSWNELEDMYMRAYRHSPDRADALVRIGRHYANSGDPGTAYRHLRLACDLPIPYHYNMNLDLELYEFGRWDLLGSVAYHVERYDEGRTAIRKALEFPSLSSEARQQLMTNLEIYERKRTS